MAVATRFTLAFGTLALLGALLPTVTNRAMTVTLTEADPVAAAAPRSATGTAYAFETVLRGKPVRWNPCAAIHWQFRGTGAPSGGKAVITSAVARIAQATGTRWVFDGVVTAAPTSGWLPTSEQTIRPVLIGWTDAAHSDLLRGQPKGVLGMTRTAWFGWTDNGAPQGAIRAAVIALDRTDSLPSTGPVSWKTVALHELGHAMGLDHAGSSRQLMYAVLQRNLADLQSGDLQGLSKVGRPAGCTGP
jgi:hypothetical protein